MNVYSTNIKNVLKFILLFYMLLSTFHIVEVQAMNEAGGGGVSSKTVDKNFDTRTATSMTAEKFDELFKNGKLSGLGSYTIEQANKYGVNAGFLSAIMAHETGWGTSDMVNEINNTGGLTCKSGSSGATWTCVPRGDRHWKKFNDVKDSIAEKAAYLKRKYHDEGVYTVYDIQQIYCPDGDGTCATTWVSGITSAMIKLGEGSGTGLLTSNEDTSNVDLGDGFPPSIFADYEEEIGNVGVDKKRNHDKTYQTYKTNKIVSFLIKILYNVTMVIGFILIGYISILWMFVLIARTRFEPLYKAVLFMTGGKIDAFDDFGKLIKLTLIFLFFIIISISGLLPLVFAAIYKFFSMFITFVFRL